MRTRLGKALGLIAVLTLVMAACGGDDDDTTSTAEAGAATTSTAAGEDFAVMPEMTDVGLILDFVPGGIHAGIYSALAEGYFEEANLNVDIQPPTSSADTLRLVVADPGNRRYRPGCRCGVAAGAR